MNPSSICLELHELLREEQECAEALLQVLESEREAIAGRNTDALYESMQEKRDLLAQLETTHARRLQMLRAGGFTVEPEGFEAFLQNCIITRADILSQWQTTRESLAMCQQRNLENGTLLERSHRITHKALSILLGEVSDSPDLYSPSGKTTPSYTSGSHVTKA